MVPLYQTAEESIVDSQQCNHCNRLGLHLRSPSLFLLQIQLVQDCDKLQMYVPFCNRLSNPLVKAKPEPETLVQV